MSNDLLHRFRNNAAQKDLFGSQDLILLAVSGGVDSMVMLDLFLKTDYEIGVAHCNFQLRGEAAEADEQLVKTVTEKYNLPFFSKRFDTRAYAEAEGVSIQMAARDLRYQWFEELRATEGYDRVATAHHLNDEIETFLFNLARGTGIRGLVGINPKEGTLIRPLLFASREEIEEYAGKKRIEWREDTSNQEEYYARNLIRKRVVPELQKLNPSLIKGFASTRSRLQDVLEILQQSLGGLRDKLRCDDSGHVYLAKSALRDQAGAATLLHELLRHYGFNYRQVLSILRGIEETGSLHYSAEFQLNIDREDLVISKRAETPEFSFELGPEPGVADTGFGVIQLDYPSAVPEAFGKDPHVVWMDAEKLQFPLRVRKWQDGDRFQPLGMKGTKKVSDLLVDVKVPLIMKENVLVIESAGEIVWVVGYRMAEWCKLQAGTARPARIRYL